jgi:DNA-directed RNA polymerase subunit omega
MMIKPTLGELLKKVDNRFALVNVVSKRARQLIDGAPTLIRSNSTKPVSIAINEVNENMITYVGTRSGIK